MNNNFKIYNTTDKYIYINNDNQPNVQNQKCRLYSLTLNQTDLVYVVINVDDNNNVISTSQAISGFVLFGTISGPDSVLISNLILYNNNNTHQTYVVDTESGIPFFKIDNIANDRLSLTAKNNSINELYINVTYKTYKECLQYIYNI